MKHFGMIIFYLIMGVVGYMLHPVVMGSSTDSDESKKVVDWSRSVEDADGRLVSVDITKIEPEDFPKEVTLKRDLMIKSRTGAYSKTLLKGDRLYPVSITGGTLTLGDKERTMTGQIGINETDYEERVMEILTKKYAEVEPEDGGNDMAGGDSGKAVEPEPEPEPVKPEPEPVKPEPEPEPEPVVVADLTAEQIVKEMKASVVAGDVTEFKSEDVMEWIAGEKATHDGEEYQTGTAKYRVETILGVKTLQAVALIKNGKVQRWVSAKSGLRLK